jgi:hypothetical protein
VKRRAIEVFSLSFLDCICCGFGAVILLFVLSLGARPKIIEEARADLRELLARRERELVEIRGQTTVISRDLEGVRRQVSTETEKVARLEGDLSRLQGEFAASRREMETTNALEGQLATALQTLSEEMKRLLAQVPPLPPAERAVGGIPVDSEYVVFIIDTSGSMQREAWPLLVAKVEETLKVYPRIKGMQFMSDQGVYLFTQYAGKWIPDTPARRQAAVAALRSWTAFSLSSPEAGIRAAIRAFYEADKKVSLFVMGDEFSGADLRGVVAEVDRANRVREKDGQRLVRIHAVGFPTIQDPASGQLGPTTVSFATLMRELCRRNGGTFVALPSVVR